MEDAVRLNADQFRAVYEDGFITWARQHSHVIRGARLPAHCLVMQAALSRHPTFSLGLNLKRDKWKRVPATGYSSWGSSNATCDHGLPTFRKPVEIEVTTEEPIPVTIIGQNNWAFASWFAHDDDYFAVLILAWTYVLSARWTEIMPATCFMRYTGLYAPGQISSTRQDDQDAIDIDIGNVSREEAQWWTAVLAPGQGWQATMTFDQHAHPSPWSICLRSGRHFCVSRVIDAPPSPPSPDSPPSCANAISYLNKFCLRHEILDQSQAALAAVLLLPYAGGGELLQLPVPMISKRKRSTDVSLVSATSQSLYEWTHQDTHIDRLLTLSCNVIGIRPVLLSVFYEPSIECNAVTPWLQGALTAINSLTSNDLRIFGRMCMERTPKLACLWPGYTVLGLQRKLLRQIRFGQIPVDLHSAAWSDTVQSFIQQPVSDPLVADGYISRADECRLLFLSQASLHTRVPVCRWKPFGTTPVDAVDIEVRLHVGCGGHGLQYLGFSWNGTDDHLDPPSCEEEDLSRTNRLPTTDLSDDGIFPIHYDSLNREAEVISKNSSRSILGWLRFDGHAEHERGIWKHPWFKIRSHGNRNVNSEDQHELSSESNPDRAACVRSWLSGLDSFKSGSES